jgi:hypothetical protein
VGIAKSFVRNEFFHSFMVGTPGAARKRPARQSASTLVNLTWNVDAG